MSEQKKSKRIGQLLVSKAGKEYIKFEKNLTIAEGDALFLSKPSDDIQGLVERGFITSEEATERISRVPEFVKRNITGHKSSN